MYPISFINDLIYVTHYNHKAYLLELLFLKLYS